MKSRLASATTGCKEAWPLLTANAAKEAKEAGQPTLDGYLTAPARTASTLAPATGGDTPLYQPTNCERLRAILNIGQSCFMNVILVLCMYAVPGIVPLVLQSGTTRLRSQRLRVG